MSVNRYQPHIFVLPEDDANRQLANGFLLPRDLSDRNIQVLEEAGGWNEVLLRFVNDHVTGMERYVQRHMVLLIDFDNRKERLQIAKQRIPEHLADRVFILGALDEPERLKSAIPGTYESIGLALARDCRAGTDATWGHPLLRHNAGELGRLIPRVRSILFPTP